MYSIRIYPLITFVGKLETQCLQIHLNSSKIFLLYPFCSFMKKTQKPVQLHTQNSQVFHIPYTYSRVLFFTKYTMQNCLHFPEVPESDEKFQNTIHCTQKSSCLPVFLYRSQGEATEIKILTKALFKSLYFFKG